MCFTGSVDEAIGRVAVDVVVPESRGITYHQGAYWGGESEELKIGVLPDQAVTVAEVMHAEGYRTAAFVANPWLVQGYGFSQGFYNLFLSIGIFVGLALLNLGGNVLVAQTLVLFSCACMLGAGVVLYLSAGRPMLRAAAIQAAFPLLAWVTWLGF